MTERLLEKHFSSLANRLLQYADHVGIAKHSNVIGAAREGIINLFLKQNLPSLSDLRTGEIVDEFDKKSGQIDIILQSALSPKLHLFGDLNIALADFVLAAIEVKSDLSTAGFDNPSHLKSALETIRKVKTLHRAELIKGKPDWKKGHVLTLPNTPCFIIAYSGPTIETLMDKLDEYGEINKLEYDDYMPAVITVLDKKYSILKNDGWSYRKTKSKYIAFEIDHCLFIFYLYLVQLIESWNAIDHPTQMGKYFEDIE